MRSCLAAVGLGALILVAVAVGWLARDEISGFVSGILNRNERTEAVELAAPGSPEMARRVEAKIVALGQGELEEAQFSGAEVDSWVQHGLNGYFPAYISDVKAGIEEERLVLDGRVAVKEIPGIERLGAAAALFGDTASVRVKGRPDGLGPGRGVFYVEVVQIGLVPLPDAMRDQLVAQLKVGGRGEFPANAVEFELPPFVTDVAVRGDHLVFRGPVRSSR